jgi:hypothetical protein
MVKRGCNSLAERVTLSPLWALIRAGASQDDRSSLEKRRLLDRPPREREGTYERSTDVTHCVGEP